MTYAERGKRARATLAAASAQHAAQVSLYGRGTHRGATSPLPCGDPGCEQCQERTHPAGSGARYMDVSEYQLTPQAAYYGRRMSCQT